MAIAVVKVTIQVVNIKPISTWRYYIPLLLLLPMVEEES